MAISLNNGNIPVTCKQFRRLLPLIGKPVEPLPEPDAVTILPSSLGDMEENGIDTTIRRWAFRTTSSSTPICGSEVKQKLSAGCHGFLAVGASPQKNPPAG